MEFNNTTDKNGLIQVCEMQLFGDSPFGKISNNPDRLKIFTSIINDAYGRYAILALMADNSWQFDDNNYTDFPIGNTDLIAGQADYTLNNDQIIIEQVEVLDPTGQVWQAVPEGDERKFAEYKLSESQYFNNVAAIPIFHIKKGNSIVLMPTPSYSITQAVNGVRGLRCRFKRPPSYFVNTDTVKLPGFVRLHHNYLTDYATWKYAFMRSMPIYKTFQQVVERWETVDIPGHYEDRSLEHPTVIRSRIRSSR